MEIKMQWDPVTYSLDWLKLQSMTIPNVCEDEEEWEASYSAGRSVNGYKHFRKQFVIIW